MKVISVNVYPNGVTITKGNWYYGAYAVVNASSDCYKDVEWYSGNSSIASVNKTTGYIYGVNPGETRIYARSKFDGSKIDHITVTVAPRVSVTGISVYPTSKTMDVGCADYLYETIYPSNATNQTVTWYSSDDSVAEVNTYSGKVTAKTVGVATITACTVDGGYSASCVVTVVGDWPTASKPTINYRSDWGARGPITNRFVSRSREPERIVFHHSAEKFNSTNRDDVIEEIQRIQNLHIDDEGKCDIAYHFIIDPAGRIWEGAYIDDYQRGHATNYFDDIGVLLLGDFESRIANVYNPNELNSAQKEAMKKISKWLCYKYNLLSVNSGQNAAPINTHRGVNPGDTICPGENAAPWIENKLREYINDWNS